MKVKFGSVLVFVALSSCSATTLKPTDYGPGEEKDSAFCEMEAEKAGSATQPKFYSETYNKVFDACMRSKGFKRNQ